MILLLAISLYILAILCYRLGRSWLYPPALYAAVWATVMAVTSIIQFRGYALTEDAVLLFTVGVMVFVVTGVAVTYLFHNEAQSAAISPQREARIKSVIAIYSIALFLLVPAFVAAINQAGQSLGITDYAAAARTALGQPDRAGIPRYFQSLSSVGITLAFCMAWLYEGSRRDKFVLGLAVGAPLVMSVLTLSRSPVFALLIGVIAILAFRKTVKSSVLATGIFAVLVVALSMGTALGKNADLLSAQGTSTSPVDSLLLYYAGGPVGFGKVMAQPFRVGESGLSLRFLAPVLTSFGLEITLSNSVLGYVSEDLGNIYTMYFAYWLDGGWLGVILISMLAGLVCTGIYVLARRNFPIAGVSLSLVVGSIVNSPVGDGLFGSVIPWLLMIALTWILWYSPLPFLEVASRSGDSAKPNLMPKANRRI